MKTICPSCGNAAVSPLKRLAASPTSPIRCPSCGTPLAARPRGIWSLTVAIFDNLAIFGGLAALFLVGWWALVLAILLALSLRALVQWRAPLQAVTRDAVKRSRRRQGWAIAVLMIGFVMVALYQGLRGG